MATANSLLPLPVTAPPSPNTHVNFSTPSPQNGRFNPPGSEHGYELNDSTVTIPPATTPLGHLVPTLLRDRMQGDNIGDGWTAHTLPHGRLKYYYNNDLKLVTTEDMEDHSTRSTFLSKYREEANKNRPFESVVYERKMYVVNHTTETWGSHDISDETRSKYWIYLYNFPCHHDLPNYAEKEALTMLQLMIAQNLANSKREACTPFSMLDIQRYIDFFNFSRTLEASHDDLPIAKGMIISNIIANFYEHSLQNSRPTQSDGAKTKSWLKIITIVACWGMPPNYLQRFHAAHNMYGRTLQPEEWKSFLDVVRGERAAANVLSGLLLASSVAFLAVPSLVDIAQFFIIMSIGLSLGCVVMGFNRGLDEKLSELQYIEPPIPSQRNKTLIDVGCALDQHYTMLLLSVLCFYLALLVFTAYSIYASVFLAKSFTIQYAFYVMATSGLLITMGVILCWNWQFRNDGTATPPAL